MIEKQNQCLCTYYTKQTFMHDLCVFYIYVYTVYVLQTPNILLFKY